MNVCRYHSGSALFTTLFVIMMLEREPARPRGDLGTLGLADVSLPFRFGFTSLLPLVSTGRGDVIIK